MAQEGEALGWSVDEEDVGERVAGGGGGMDDADLKATFDRAEGAGIHDVAVEMAVRSEVLLIAVCGGEACVSEEDGGDWLCVGCRRGDDDAPAPLAGRVAERIDRAAASAQERGGDVVGAQDGDGGVHGEAFADAAGVEVDAGNSEVDGSCGRVEVEVAIADNHANFGEIGGSGDPTSRTEEPPGLHQRADGDIEGSVAGLTPVVGLGEEAKGLGIGGRWSKSGFAVDSREFG